MLCQALQKNEDGRARHRTLVQLRHRTGLAQMQRTRPKMDSNRSQSRRSLPSREGTASLRNQIHRKYISIILQLQSLELCQATRNRRQRAPANGRHTIEFNAAGCPANANLRQNLQAKAKVKRTQSSTKLRVAHLFVKRSSAFMLAAPAWHHARAAHSITHCC